jgi:hypothetical protein
MTINKILFVLAFLISLESYSMERAPLLPVKLPNSPANYLDRLPRDLQNEVLQFAKHGTGILNIPILARTINAMQNSMSTPRLVTILNALPTRAAGRLLLKRLYPMPAQIECERNTHYSDYIYWKCARNGKEQMLAIKNGEVKKVQELLKNPNIDLELVGGTKRDFPLFDCPLYLAIYKGNAEIVKCLLEAGAAANYIGIYHCENLIEACKKRNKEIVAHLVAAGADLNKRDEYERTPLLYSIMAGDMDSAAILLKAGANPELKDYAKWGALDYLQNKNDGQGRELIPIIEAAVAARRPKVHKVERDSCSCINCVIQ